MKTYAATSLLIWLTPLGVQGIQNDFDGCNIMVYNDNGMFSAIDTLQACAAQMASPALPVTFDVNFHGNMTVACQMVCLCDFICYNCLVVRFCMYELNNRI